MKSLETEVLVIGGGATGTGIIRDLAMRGIQAVLVEKGDLAHGTSGKYHGLLHSGSRYVVSDPQAAKECIEENKILRRIMPMCIEDTGGYFVTTPWDDSEYVDSFTLGCRQAGIPYESIPINKMLSEEPFLNPQITNCYWVPDASADSFLAAELNAESARQHSATILNYHSVTGLIIKNNAVIGASCLNLVEKQSIEIYARIVVNASGAWAGQLAQYTGIELPIIGGKGTMIATNHRLVNTVINRCKYPSDGDILVPAHTVSIIGTTDVRVEKPDQYPIDEWEIDLLLEEGEKLIPGFRKMRILRAWAGVRPLYSEVSSDETRQASRSFVLLDHEALNGVEGFITITSGKWTTYRMMGEVTTDLVCKKLKVDKKCRTHSEELPHPGESNFHFVGERLNKIEKEFTYGKLICECELVTGSDIIESIKIRGAQSIDDIRRDTRLGMGPCQGGFCTYRAAGIIHKYVNNTTINTNNAMLDFLQERWKGLLPILWGQQLRQERLDQLIYINNLNIDHLLTDSESPFRTTNYESSSVISDIDVLSEVQEVRNESGDDAKNNTFKGGETDIIVIGAGLAGLSAAWRAGTRNKRTLVLSKGIGTTHWSTGCIDVFGYNPGEDANPIISLDNDLRQFIQNNHTHPYSILGIDFISKTLESLKELFSNHGYPLYGSLEENTLTPTSTGSLRPTCLVPEMMINGIISVNQSHNSRTYLVVGFDHYSDFFPEMISDNLTSHGVNSSGISLDLKLLRAKKTINSTSLARLFDTHEIIPELVSAIIPHLNGITHIGLPAVLGLRNPLQVKNTLESQIGLPIFEIPTLPPSIPGMRIFNILVNEIKNSNGQIYIGSEVVSADTETAWVNRVWTEAAARRVGHSADNYILATGGILGGRIEALPGGYTQETIFGLHSEGPKGRSNWFNAEFLSTDGHPLFKCGVTTNSSLQPVDNEGQPVFKNLYSAGNSLYNTDAIKTRSVEGIAITTGAFLGDTI